MAQSTTLPKLTLQNCSTTVDSCCKYYKQPISLKNEANEEGQPKTAVPRRAT